MSKPNFLIVGAAKCGTTSLAKYLDLHPEVFIPEIKEPRFLIADALKKVSKRDPSYNYIIKNSILNPNEYFNLFAGRTENAIGEGSVHYLYHYEEAIPNIVKHLGWETKIIILLRNPVDRAISNWKYQDKDFVDFRSALDLEDQRIRENYNSFWYYKRLGYYFEQVKAYQDNFTDVKVVLFEDFILKTDEVMREMFAFLEVSVDYTIDSYLQHNKTSMTVVPKTGFLKALFKNQKGINLFKHLIKLNLVPRVFWTNKKELVNENDRLFLKETYHNNIKKTEQLIRQDLSSWI
ncbi:MAG: sulfotransferase [Bacteroidota bacterium]